MKIPLRKKGPTPLYQQIESWLRRAITAGDLPPGARLPSSRALAEDCGVSRITTDTVYARMQADGLLVTRAGSGTFVHESARQRSALEAASAPWAPGGSSREKPAASQSQLAFERGQGDPRLYPVAELRRQLNRILRAEPQSAFSYGGSLGDEKLRRNIASVLSSRGLRARLENVLITSGSQQGIALTASLVARESDPVVVVEAPTYPAALTCFRQLGLKIISVPVDDEGMQVERLAALLARGTRVGRPRLLYTIPTYQNPTGVCLATGRRLRLLEIAACHGLTVIEDDFVGDLRYEGSALPTLAALDQNGLVIHIGTFSKMLMPGLRIGFLVANEQRVAELGRLKAVHDIASCHPMQRALSGFIRLGRYEVHLRRSCRRYRERRNAMLAAVRRHLSEVEVPFIPKGGLFLWLRVSREIDPDRLLEAARREGVSFATGPEFFVEPRAGRRYLRLNFAMHTPEEIDRGVLCLKAALRLARGDGSMPSCTMRSRS